MAKIVEENFRYDSKADKDLVTAAYNKSTENKRTHFVRNIVLRFCRITIHK